MFESMDLNSLLPQRSSDASTDSQQQEDEGWMPSLTFQERMIGCGTCMVFGYLLSFGSFVRFKDLVFGNPVPFAVNATVGNIIALCGSFFMSGPQQQMKKMWHESRRTSSICYLSSLGVTLVLACIPKFLGQGLLLLVCLLFQWVSIFWYCLSYIPFARDAIKTWCRRLVHGEDG
jgi:hypothetical protein